MVLDVDLRYCIVSSSIILDIFLLPPPGSQSRQRSVVLTAETRPTPLPRESQGQPYSEEMPQTPVNGNEKAGRIVS